MDAVVCQYCNTEVSLVEVEKEGGLCPECGAMMNTSRVWDADDDDFDEDADIEEVDDIDDVDDLDDYDDDDGDDEDEDY